ncbi:MAG: threonine/serine exporter family protein [Neisseriales bacterium]|nr:MAG: threonine/serine exporter family protein [Neisseriales bacterium]
MVEQSKNLLDNQQVALDFLHGAARLMVTYNTRTYLLQRHLNRIAQAIGLDNLSMDIGYCRVTLFTKQGTILYAYTPEFCINIAFLAKVMHIIDKVCAHTLSPREGLLAFETIERTAENRQWSLAALFSAAAASAIAFLAKGDISTMVAVGFAAAGSIMVQKYLTHKQIIKLMLPFAGSFFGAIFCSFWIRMGWTTTPNVCLIVPVLLMIPGPHLINGLYDIVENNIQTGIARLCLAASIVIASSCGVLLGSHLMFLESTTPILHDTVVGELPLWLDAVMAGVTSCGFAAFYNAPWRVLVISSLYGMMGHAIRYFLLDSGYSLESSTFFACLAVGFFANFMAEYLRIAFSAVAFASAMPMMPGMLMFSAINHATSIATYGQQAEPVLVVLMLSELFKSTLVLGAMVAGLLIGACFARIFAEGLDRPLHQIKRQFRM